ncbi:FAD binding domain-containing protein [Amycolatopsis acidiphila]|uniref:Xanthine dehydrogenase family protein subunit M n=1 Tax=Amycolatopsis acidiphila TaxID=715473 RepID=A0A558AM71_9PSEU|nr:FAD binding domain-containing protein [Amycolatopsis acidiphila]TVT25365.1 xanthine dehydrogenase family protein subunit M [Amycolatopsis acidiphila]UIJ62497.1 FAD binding domain-containing protein [Amycolatopsis acidiphila]GHG83953.1 carbon monoxide dehydrogenase [Amycolatopsis acidiphila]
MKPAPFDYLRAHSVGEAVRALADADGDGKIIAGGQSLLPVLALRMARPRLLVDINRIPGLSTITPVDGGVRLGALVRHARLAGQTAHPLLAEAARWIGHTAIRSRGTSGGSIAHADPAAELPVVAAALEATIHIAGPGGTRATTATELFTGPLETTLAEDEMITAIDLPSPQRWGFAEFSRRHGDFGLVTVVAAEVAGRWRLALGGVGGVPLRPAEAEHLLNDGAPVEQVAAAAAAAVTPSGDIHASAEYRRAMTEEFTRRALTPDTERAAA